MSNNSDSMNLTMPSLYIIPPILKFWLYLIFLIPSLVCTLFVLYHLLFVRALRHSLHNHVIIILLFTVLFCELTQYPWMLYYHLQMNTWQRPYIFCAIWGFIDWAVYMLQLILFAWATIERHILIFHDKWVSTKKKRLYCHYLPIILIFLYWFIFYSYIYFYPSCTNTYASAEMICMTVCSFNSFSLHAFDTLFNNIIPTLTIVTFSGALFVRVLHQKQRVRQRIHWKRHRKMAIQLLSISTLYLFVTAPWALIILLRMCGLPPDVGASFETMTSFLDYFIVPLFPFVALLSLPELQVKLRQVLRVHRPRRSVEPEILLRRNVQKNPVFAQ